MGRMRRGAAADRIAARMTEEIVLDDDEPEDNPEDIVVVEEEPEPEEPADLIDTSHVEDDGEDDEPEPEPDDGLADLQRQLDAMSARNTQLEAVVGNAVVAEIESQHREVEIAINVAKGMLATARNDFETALKAGDHKAAADAQLKITEAHADVREFEGAAAEIKGQIAQAKKAPRTAAAATPSDPFEASIAGVSDPSKEWCRRNKADLTKSPTRANRALVAHQEAIESGHKADSPEYFKFLDKQMGYEANPAVTKTTTKTAKPVGKARTAAPGGSRSAPSGGGAEEVRLSKNEIAIAKSFNMTPKQYAEQKKEIIKNGRDPNRSGPRYSSQTEANRR